MKIFKDKVAVITGAASGIGRSLAVRSAREGMKVVLADVEEGALAQAEGELKAEGASVTSMLTDVSNVEDMEALARHTLDTYGAVHLLCNSAGVGAGGSIWESTWKDWQWVLGVNLWGVIHGVKVFVPIMLSQTSEGHIVNVASAAGLLTNHPSAPYQVTKHAVVSLSEHLYHSLAQRNAKIKTSVLCPGWVKTQIMDSARNRPPELQNKPEEVLSGPEVDAVIEFMRKAVEGGLSPDQVAEKVFEAIQNERFYILTHPEFNPVIQARLDSILGGLNPPKF